MKSGGKTTDIGVGRQLLCKEKPNTRVKSQCAKRLTKTIKAAKKGLTAKQQKLWRKYVYTSALLQAQRFCEKYKYTGVIISGAKPPAPTVTKAQKYSKCVGEVLSGTRKIKGLFKTKFKWSDYLIKGAAIIKRVPSRRLPKCTRGRIRVGNKCKCPMGLKWIKGKCKKEIMTIE